MKKVLLHVCCGVCEAYSIKKLKDDNYYVEAFYFNPNIHPEKEYLRRKKEAEKVASINRVKFIEGAYNPSIWFDACSRYNKEKEGGRRCILCYELRLKEAFKRMNEMSFDYFTTTLTISPHKRSMDIFEIGKRIGGDHFLPIDFKKKDGFKNTIQLAKDYGLYRQDYCGCVYSLIRRQKDIKL